MALKNKDHLCFEIVGHEKNATEDDIKQEYTKVALQHQPDIQNYSEGNSNGLSVEEIEHQHKENFQRKLLEEERLQRIEANERLKNKRQQRKNSKEKKKQIRLEAEKILQEKKFSKPPPEKEKSELEKHEEKLNYLFGEKEINNNMMQNTANITTDSVTKSLLLGKHFSEIAKTSVNSDKQECKAIENTNQNSNAYKPVAVSNQRETTTVIKQRETTAVVKQRGTTTVIKQREVTAEQKESLITLSVPSSQQTPQTDRLGETKHPADSQVKSSLLQRHLQEYSDLMKVQPKRHTEQQIRAERIRQKEEQQTLHQQELDSLRSKQTQEFVPVPTSPSDADHALAGEDECVQEEFERMRKEHLRKQQELERKRNEEEAQELKTYRNKKQKWKELKVEDVPQKWFEKEDSVTRDPPPKVKEPPPPSVNVWQQRHLRQQQLTSLAPRTPQEEEEILNQVLLLSQKTAAQEEEQRKYREILSAKNFIPEKIQKEEKPSALFNRPVNSAEQRNTAKTVTASQTTKKISPEPPQTRQDTRPTATTQQEFPSPASKPVKKTTTEQVENIWEILPNRAEKETFPSKNWFSSSKKEETAPKPVLTMNYANTIPPPRLHIPQQMVKEESWDNDGDFLYVSNKLPTTARECLRWQNNAKIVMSASRESQPNTNNSAQDSTRQQGSKLSVDKHITCTVDENHNDITRSTASLMDSKLKDSKLVYDSSGEKQGKTRDYGENTSEAVKSGRYLQSSNSDLKRSETIECGENQSEAVESGRYPQTDQGNPNRRNPWTNVVIEHQTVDPRPNAETVWSDNKQKTEKALHSAQIPPSTHLHSAQIPPSTHLHSAQIPPSTYLHSAQIPPSTYPHSAQIPPSTHTSRSNPAFCQIPAGQNLDENKTFTPTASQSMLMFKPGDFNAQSTGIGKQMTTNEREVGVQNSWPQSTCVEISQPFSQNPHDFWNISVKNSDNTPAQNGKTQQSSMDRVCDESEEKASHEEKTRRLIASLQQKTYQTSSGGSRVSHDYWDLTNDISIKAQTEHSPEIFVSPENVNPEKEKLGHVETGSGASTVKTKTPVLSFVQNYDEQATLGPENVLKGEILKEERSNTACNLPTSSSDLLHSNNSLETTQRAAVLQSDEKTETVPQKKVSNMLNKLAKLGLNPNPIKKEKNGENPSLSKPFTPASQKSHRPGYRRRPMKTVAKSPTNPTDTLPTENWETAAKTRSDGISGSEDRESALNQDQVIPSVMNAMFSSSSKENSETSEGNWKKSQSSSISSDVGSQRNQSSSLSRQTVVDQTRQQPMVEDWESELITLPPDTNTLPAPTCPATTEAKNFFKEIMKSVKKDAMKPRLPVLKHLTTQEESPPDGSSKTDQSPTTTAQTSPSSIEWIERNEQFKESIAQKTSTKTKPDPVFQGQHHSVDYLTNQGRPQTTCHPSTSVKPSSDISPRDSVNEDTAPPRNSIYEDTAPQMSTDFVHPAAQVDPMQVFSAANSKDTRVPEFVHTPPPPNLPHPSQSPPVYPQVPGVGPGLVAGNPGSLPNFGLPMPLPPHLLQAYLHYLATTSNALGTGLLPGLPLLPGIAPLMPLGLPNPTLPNPLLSYNLMGLPGQPFVDPSTLGGQPPMNMSANPPQADVSSPQSHASSSLLNAHPLQPCVNPPQHDVQPPRRHANLSQHDAHPLQHDAHPSQHDADPSQHDAHSSQHNAHPLSQSQSQCEMQIKSAHHQIPNVDYQSDSRAYGPSSQPSKSYPPQNNYLPQQKVIAEEKPQLPNSSRTKNTILQPSKFDSQVWNDDHRGSVFENSQSSSMELLEAKLPETLQKRKEQTRTVQALIQHILKENQERTTVDLIPEMDRM